MQIIVNYTDIQFNTYSSLRKSEGNSGSYANQKQLLIEVTELNNKAIFPSKSNKNCNKTNLSL